MKILLVKCTLHGKNDDFVPETVRLPSKGIIHAVAAAVLSRVPVPTAWRVLGLRLEETPYRYGR